MFDSAQLIKYVLEGLAVAAAAYYISGKNRNLRDIALLGLAAAVTFLVLDLFAPNIAAGSRQGAGFGIGQNMVGGGETEEQLAEVQANVGKPYKLREGQYAAQIVQPGYNENVRAFNSIRNKFSSSCASWNKKNSSLGNSEQFGGAAEEQEAEPALAPAPEGGEGQQASNGFSSDDPRFRKAGVLYSGDLVNLTADGQYLQRGVVDSQIVFDKPLPNVGTNLSKLRFVHANKHSQTEQTILNYGDPVYLKHNAYFNNKNEGRFVKYGEKLQSHQEGPLFRVFKIYDPSNLKRVGPVEAGSEVILGKGDQEGSNIYMKVESDKSATCKSTAQDATKVKIQVNRVYELHDKNLCVGPNDILYP